MTLSTLNPSSFLAVAGVAFLLCACESNAPAETGEAAQNAPHAMVPAPRGATPIVVSTTASGQTLPAPESAGPVHISNVPDASPGRSLAPAAWAGARVEPLPGEGPRGTEGPVGDDQATAEHAAPATETTRVEAPATSPEITDPGASDQLSVVEAVVARGVEDRQPRGASEQFTPGTVWAWVKVKNPGQTSQIRMFWKREGEIRSRVDLDVGTSPRWRTWSRKTLSAEDVGDWKIEIRTWDERLLDTVSFRVEREDFAERGSF